MELGGISYKVKIKPEGHMEGGLDLVTLALPGTGQLGEGELQGTSCCLGQGAYGPDATSMVLTLYCGPCV